MYHKIRHLIIDTSKDLPYLIKSYYSKKVKLNIFFTYLRLRLIFIFFYDSSKHTEKIFGFKVDFFDFESFLMQFREMFLHNQYYFYTNKTHPIVFDCGANIGISVIFFKWLYPKCIIYAFEPDLKTFDLLKRNVKRNGFCHIHLYNIALSDKNCKTKLFVNLDDPGNPLMSLIYERLPKDTVNVIAQPLSTFIKKIHVDLLKMDIEGMEERVLAEVAKKNLMVNIKELIIEYHKGIINNKSTLSSFLNLLDIQGYKYRIDAQAAPLYRLDTFQDILVYAHK